jgi:hypothetical protein
MIVCSRSARIRIPLARSTRRSAVRYSSSSSPSSSRAVRFSPIGSSKETVE